MAKVSVDDLEEGMELGEPVLDQNGQLLLPAGTLSLVRLARLHGTGQVMRESLLASDEWHAATDRLHHWLDRPELKLNA